MGGGGHTPHLSQRIVAVECVIVIFSLQFLQSTRHLGTAINCLRNWTCFSCSHRRSSRDHGVSDAPQTMEDVIHPHHLFTFLRCFPLSQPLLSRSRFFTSPSHSSSLLSALLAVPGFAHLALRSHVVSTFFSNFLVAVYCEYTS